MKIKQVHIDMDGVLCDWVGGVCDLLGKHRILTLGCWPRGEYEIESTFDMSTDRLWNLINRQGIDWWSHLDPLPHIVPLIDLVSEFSAPISILTSPGVCEYAATGKFRWIKQHLPQYQERLYLCRDKYLMANEDRLLIDDNDDNCRRFREEGGQAILFPQPWNEKHIYSNRPMESVKHQLNGILGHE